MLTRDAPLGVEFLPEKMLHVARRAGAQVPPGGEDETTLDGATHALRRRLVIGALQAENGNRAAAAKRLGISRSYLHRLITELGIH